MVYIVSGMWMQPYFISLSSLLTAIVSKSQMKQIQRTSSLLKTFYIFVQFVADDLLKYVFYHGSIRLVHITYLFIFIYVFCLFAAERIIPFEKKETYNLYLVFESNFLRENIKLRLWHACVCLIKLKICSCHLQLWPQGFGKEGCCHNTGLSVYGSSVVKVCNWSRRSNT